jgi:hypothetical protein
MTEPTERAAAPPITAAVPSGGDTALLDAFLQALARAVRQFHTYPATSPLCVDAIGACHQALATVEATSRLVFQVVPRALLSDDVALGTGTVIEQELVRRLTLAHVAVLEVDRCASVRDLSRFCMDLLCAADDESVSLADLLSEHGVGAIVPRMAARVEVFDLGSPRPDVRSLVEHERGRHDAMPAGGRPTHLYPPGRGWVRLDPGTTLGPISLVDLAVLVQDPTEIATMLLRLTGDEIKEPAPRVGALERKFSDVARLIASLESNLSRLMFARLARAVLAMEPERRQALLKQTILPGLLDGRVDATILHDFPDPDLAESLCLLLDLETAAPDVVAAALDRLDLEPDRRRAVVPLLEARLRDRAESETPARGAGAGDDVDRYVGRLLRVDPSVRRSFSDLNAFDLSIDEQTTQALTRIREQVLETDPTAVQLGCLLSVIRLEPNPTTVDTLLVRASALLADQESADRWEDVSYWLSALRETAERLREPRPDVAAAIDAGLAAFCTCGRMARVVELAEAGSPRRDLAGAFVESCGGSAARAWIGLLNDAAGQAKERTVVQLLCEHAATMAPALETHLSGASDNLARAIVRVLAWAGPGYEASIAAQFTRSDEATMREALRALARIGTAEAAVALAAQIEHANPRVRAAAEESLWHLPPARLQAQVRDLLGRLDFVLRQPATAGRMIERAARSGIEVLGQTVAYLAPLRFRVWSPAIARVGRQAHRLVTK